MANQSPLVKVPGVGWRLRSKLPLSQEGVGEVGIPLAENTGESSGAIPVDRSAIADPESQVILEDLPKPESTGRRSRKNQQSDPPTNQNIGE
jgi:hypothetical protein